MALLRHVPAPPPAAACPFDVCSSRISLKTYGHLLKISTYCDAAVPERRAAGDEVIRRACVRLGLATTAAGHHLEGKLLFYLLHAQSPAWACL